MVCDLLSEFCEPISRDSTSLDLKVKLACILSRVNTHTSKHLVYGSTNDHTEGSICTSGGLVFYFTTRELGIVNLSSTHLEFLILALIRSSPVKNVFILYLTSLELLVYIRSIRVTLTLEYETLNLALAFVGSSRSSVDISDERVNVSVSRIDTSHLSELVVNLLTKAGVPCPKVLGFRQ